MQLKTTLEAVLPSSLLSSYRITLEITEYPSDVFAALKSVRKRKATVSQATLHLDNSQTVVQILPQPRSELSAGGPEERNISSQRVEINTPDI